MDDKFQVARPLTDEEYAGLKKSILEKGVLQPVEIDENGNILDGHHRVKACKELGISYPTKTITGLETDEDKIAYAETVNYERRQLSREEKQERLRKKIIDNPEKSDRQIAREVGVHQSTVGTQRRKLIESGQVSKLDTSKGADGKTYKRPEQKGEEGLHYSKETGERVLAAIKASPEKSHTKIAEELGLNRRTVDRVANDNAEERSEIDARKLSTRAFNKQIMELAKSKSIYSEDDIRPSEYTVDDALGEINVMWNQFYDNMMFLFRHRMTVVGGQREVTDLIKSFKTEIDQLINVVKKKGVVI